MNTGPLGRREFLGASGPGLVSALAVGRSVSAHGLAANETIEIGCIGTGGRCRRLMSSLQQIEGVRIAAVCDAWDVHLAQAQSLADRSALVTKEYRQVLDRKDIDAVLIATPDHWHVPMTVAACQAGKDVYVEKPLTHDLAEGALAVKAQDDHRRIVQVGMQQRSMPQFQEALAIVRSGKLGRVHKVHLTWNRNSPRGMKRKLDIDPRGVDWKAFLGSAPDQPFDEYRFRNWRWFWDFGGGILTDLMVHFLDVANWLLELGPPASAATIGDHFQTQGVWETPDTIQTLLHYPDSQVQVYFEGTFVNARNAAMLEFMGTQATLYLDRGRYEIHPEAGKGEPHQMILGTGKRGADFFDRPDGELLHLANWVDCMRSRQTPNAPAQAGVRAVEGAHLGNRAYRTGQVARWDPGSRKVGVRS